VGLPRADALQEIERLRSEVEELRASRMRLALASDAERSGLESALHEGVQQELVGLAATLDLVAASVEADPVAAKRLLAEMRDDVQRAMEETRALAHRIYPPLLEAGGLGAALRWIAAGANIPIRIDIAAAKDCPKEVAAAVYFCCQEMIDRVPEGTPLAVSVRRDDAVLTYEVVAECDIESEVRVQDRAAALGGEMTIRREPGRQTQVLGSIPLPG
jgi:signal transduction histidine kinase